MLQTIERKRPPRRALQMPSRMAGARGLLVAIITLAAKDALYSKRHRAGALAYFQSEQYQQHLIMLGLDPDWLPMGIERGME